MKHHGKWEVEQKFVVEAPDALRKQLDELGFQETHRGWQRDRYFRHPCRDFRQTGEAFRVRQDGGRCVVTYKGARTADEVKTRPEIELHIDSQELESWEELLRRLGFQPLPPVEKRRITFRPPSDAAQWRGIVVVLDEVVGLGNFAEIECVVPVAEATRRAQRTIQELAARLDLRHVERRSYLSLALAALGIE